MISVSSVTHLRRSRLVLQLEWGNNPALLEEPQSIPIAPVLYMLAIHEAGSGGTGN